MLPRNTWTPGERITWSWQTIHTNKALDKQKHLNWEGWLLEWEAGELMSRWKELRKSWELKETSAAHHFQFNWQSGALLIRFWQFKLHSSQARPEAAARVSDRCPTKIQRINQHTNISTRWLMYTKQSWVQYKGVNVIKKKSEYEKIQSLWYPAGSLWYFLSLLQIIINGKRNLDCNNVTHNLQWYVLHWQML